MRPEQTQLDRPTRMPWPPILLVGSIIGALVLAQLAPLAWPGINDLAARVIGLGFGVVGVFVMAWALWTLHTHKTNILPNKAADKLITVGPYSRFRNPIYLGDALIILGLAELTHNLWFVIFSAVFVALVTWLAILPEEQHLEHKFGDAYRDYVKRSRRWI